MTIVAATAFCLLAIAVGWMSLSRIWADEIPLPANALAINALSMAKFVMGCGLGIGISSSVWFICMLIANANAWAPLAVLFVLLVLLIVVGFYQKSRRTNNKVSGTTLGSDYATNDASWLKQLTIFAGVFSLICFAGLTFIYPYGDWDALMIWNLHAKFLLAGKEYWQNIFFNYLFWSHPDYPLLLSGFIASLWRVLAFPAPAVPAMVALFFFLATALLVFSIVFIVRGKVPAMWALALLVSTPNVIEQAANQCADIPLGFYMLSSPTCLFACW
jgi:hypothetical protein